MRESRNDIEISTIANAVKANNLRATIAEKPEFQAYARKEGELSVEQGALMWGARVVIQKKTTRPTIEEYPHVTHGHGEVKITVSRILLVAQFK